jgi:glutamine amidotransferase
MCELLAISSRLPTTVEFSLARLARHGGIEAPHRDGWGVAFYEGPDVLLLREPRAAAASELVRCIEKFSPSSQLVISHIRLATQGEVALRNTQPFTREMGGYTHVFAHNGKLTGIEAKSDFQPQRFKQVGNTDSELVFCILLDRLERLWSRSGDRLPELAARLDVVAQFAAQLRPHGPANFLYADGDVLFVHSHRRTQQDGEIRPPGLHLLERACNEFPPDLSAAGITLADHSQEVSLIASVPLTEEPWQPLAEGELAVIRHGSFIERCSS